MTGLPERIIHLGNNANFEFVTHDIVHPYEPGQNIDWVLHGASIASPTIYRLYPLETIDVNVTGTRMMLDLAHRAEVRGYLQLSSSEIYGDPAPAEVPTDENYVGRVSCTGPRACYDESKRLGETLVMTYFRLYSVPAKIVRPFNVYGPGQRLDDARIIPDLMSAALGDRPIALFSDGRATRAFCYVSDFVSAMLLLLVLGQPGEAYNVGNDEELSIAQAADTMVGITCSQNVFVKYESNADPQYITDNPQRRCPKLDKVIATTGWSPSVPLKEGLDRTLRSYREESALASG